MAGLMHRSSSRFRRSSEEARSPRRKRQDQAPERLQDTIGEHLRLYYAELVKEPMPDRLTVLIDQLLRRERRS